MGFDLISLSHEDCKMYFNNVTWGKLLDLAYMYGWKPVGTQPGISNEIVANGIETVTEKWNGDYDCNDGRIVTSEDASKIAAALEAALDDIPDIKTKDNRIKLRPGDDISGTNINDILAKFFIDMGFDVGIPNSNLHPFDYFSGDNKQAVISFIKICRIGAFEIW